MSEVKTPWENYMGDVPMHLDYFQGSMFDAVERMADMYPNYIAFDFMGRSVTYRRMVQEIEKCAKSLKTLGVRPGDRITIAMPNCPQAIYMFYAVNPVGGEGDRILSQRLRVHHGHHAGPVLQQVRAYPPEHPYHQHHHRVGEG